MCGIIGVASQRSVTERGWLAAGRDAMRHRGPDDAGEWWAADGRVGLGHRRLAIIDLSVAGHQPMHAGELCIVFNGEIYNFADLRSELGATGVEFRSRSDTEVILAAYRVWGTDCLARLNGMFAFALYDAARDQLFLARDRAGEKPLFYTIENDTIRFASELKGLMADARQPRRIDAEALDCYLAGGFIPGDRCILRGVKKLPPAHAMVFDLKTGNERVWRYWQLPEWDPSSVNGSVDDAALVEELEKLLEDAVRRQLVASDVPVGVLLSGGVDSSLVTAMAVRASPMVKTFTIRFPGHARFDETEHARLIARHFGTEHVELEAQPTTVDLLSTLARQFDEPLIDSSMLPTCLVSHLVRQQCTVALGGDGGDELFGGYSTYDRLLKMERAAAPFPKYVKRPVASMATLLPVGFKGRNWLQALAVDLRAGVPLIATYFDRRSRQHLMSGHSEWSFVAEQVHRVRTPRAHELLQRSSRMDFENYLAEDILVKVDRASMLNSLEVRAPMLDFRIIEFAFGKVPTALKAGPSGRKILLKKLAARVLPPSFDQHRKQGFSIPLDAWLQAPPWQQFFLDVLLDGGQTLFDHRVIRRLFRGQGRWKSNGERLFGLVMFELWRREYQVQL